jgi:hypothetical protein
MWSDGWREPQGWAIPLDDPHGRMTSFAVEHHTPYHHILSHGSPLVCLCSPPALPNPPFLSTSLFVTAIHPSQSDTLSAQSRPREHQRTMAAQVQTMPRDADLTPPKDIPLPSDSPAPKPSTMTSMACPDPSAHKAKDTSLQDHASAAAMHGSGPSKSTSSNRREVNPLGPNGKLSSAGECPSFEQRIAVGGLLSRILMLTEHTKALPQASSTPRRMTSPASPLSVLTRTPLPALQPRLRTQTRRAPSGGRLRSRLRPDKRHSWRTATKWPRCGNPKQALLVQRRLYLRTEAVRMWIFGHHKLAALDTRPLL